MSEREHVFGLNEVLLKACAAKPARRYATAGAMHADLLRLRTGRKRSGRVSPLLATVGALAVIAAVTAGVWFSLRDGAAPVSPAVAPPLIAFSPEPSLPAPTPLSPATPPIVTTGSLKITSEPTGGSIVVSQGEKRVRQGISPLLLEDLPVGEYAVRGELGLASTTAEVSVYSGREAAADLRFPTGDGTVKITSAPGGAIVYEGDREIGRTPLLCEDIKPGIHRYRIVKPGYKEATLEGTVHPEEQTVLLARLEHNLGPVPGQPWTNSLGMVFIRVGDVRFSIWETRVKDYAVFCEKTGRSMPRPDFRQNEEHPVVLVNWHDAMSFCDWLTQKERGEGRLNDRQIYRLPRDNEWSFAVGLPIENGMTPERRDGLYHKIYPWGREWPPKGSVGNYADQTLRKGFIPGYTDGFQQTATVGSFAPSASGLYDLGGNVWEWCLEGYKGGTDPHDWGVLRGGSYANSNRTEVESSYRNVVSRDDRDVIYGFRCVLADEAAADAAKP
jgi:hypothetical protein